MEDALRKSGATKRFRRMMVNVVRATPDGQNRVAMKAAYDREKRRIDPATNYALHPGDRVIISEDSSSHISEAMGDALGPFGSLVSR